MEQFGNATMEFIGHEKQWKFLKSSFEQDNLSHAYLFYGPEQLGKRKVALEFIKLLNCEGKSSEKPCQECKSCVQIENDNFPDLTYIKPEGEDIKISQIRDLIQKFSLKPYSASFKAAVIDQAHLMTQEAESALLKTIEEPKGEVVLILVTSHREKLPKTLISRTQKIKFYPVKNSLIEKFLEKKGLAEQKAEKITALSLGRPGLAIDLGLNSEFKNYQEKMKDIENLIGSTLAKRFDYAEKLSKGEEDLGKILEIWLNYFRAVFLSKVEQRNSKYLEQYSLSKTKAVINTIQKIHYLIGTTNINKRLALEMLMLKL